ncbi:MAG: DUF3524 domain-containing protein [Deltaproteobacteria bacterium]|nr:DUF3524 domain-containing protein [Deltaproteobacteria bacterium]
MKFLFLEPFFGGSHQQFAQGLISHSKYKIDLITLPARFWKWRMRGAALYFLQNVSSLEKYDGLITTDLMSLSDFKSISGAVCPPSLVYFHENQLTYPLAPDERMDYQFGFTDITTALAADLVLFNSKTHFDAFFSGIPAFLNMMPEYKPHWTIKAIKKKANYIYPGCQFPEEIVLPKPKSNSTPLIIWNHRWEFDKNPKGFFNAIDGVAEKGLNFRLALLGENFQKVPKEFIAAKKRYKNHIVQYGYVKSRKKYFEWLKKGSIIISTAQQENFGMSVIEAIRCGCIPLLPDRLAYPEILPKAFHSDFLYKSQDELTEKLFYIIKNLNQFQNKRLTLIKAMDTFSWKSIIHQYDNVLEKLAGISN